MRYVWSCMLLILSACTGNLFSFSSNGSGTGSTKSPAKATSKSSSSKNQFSTTSSKSSSSSSSSLSERQLLGTFEGGDLIDHITTRNTSGTSVDFSTCRTIAAPTVQVNANQTPLYVFPSGCVQVSGGNMTVPSGARYVIYSGTKIVNTTFYVNGRLDVMGTYARYVEFDNVRIIPTGNEQEVNLRQVNWYRGSFYQDNNNYTQANTRVKLVNFRNLDQPVYFYKPSKQSFILNSTFLDTQGVVLEATENRSIDDQIDFKFNEVRFSNTSSLSIPYALTVIRKEGTLGNNLIIEYNSFPNKNRAALKLEVNSGGTDHANPINIGSNYWGTLNWASVPVYGNPGVDLYDTAYAEMALVLSRMEGYSNYSYARYTGHYSWTCPINMKRNCIAANDSLRNNDNLTSHYLYGDLPQNTWNSYPRSNVSLPSELVNGTMAQNYKLTRGIYDYTGSATKCLIKVPEDVVLEFDAGVYLKNCEIQVLGGELKIWGNSTEPVQLEKVDIRILANTNNWSEVEINYAQIVGGSIVPYEIGVQQRTALKIMNSIIEGLELPIYAHSVYSGVYISGNIFMRSRGIVTGHYNGHNGSDIEIYRNRFIEGIDPYYVFVQDLPTYSSALVYGQAQSRSDGDLLVALNNFMLDSNTKAVYFSDNLKNRTTQKFRLSENFVLDAAASSVISDFSSSAFRFATDSNIIHQDETDLPPALQFNLGIPSYFSGMWHDLVND